MRADRLTIGVYDTDRPGVDAIVNRAIEGFVDGSILLMHDGRSLDPAPDASQVVDALPHPARSAAPRFRLLTISQLLSESTGRRHTSGAASRRPNTIHGKTRVR
jgi:hypothetical protein